MDGIDAATPLIDGNAAARFVMQICRIVTTAVGVFANDPYRRMGVPLVPSCV